MSSPRQLLTLLAGKAPEKGLPFLLSGAITGAVPDEALRAIALDPDLYPSVYDDPELLAGLSLYIHDTVGSSNLSLPCAMRVESEAYGGEKDLYAGESPPFELSRNAVFEYPLKELADYKGLKGLNPESDGRMPVVLETLRLLKLARRETPVIGDLVGPLSLATSLIDGKTLLRSIKSEGALLREFLGFLTENTISFARAQARAGAEAFFLLDPFATAEILGAEFFELFALPYYNRIAECLGEEGCPLIVHICGEPRLLADTFARMLCEGLSLHRAPAGLAGLDGKLLVGGIEALQLLGFGGSAQERAAIACSVEAAVFGGFSVIAPSCSLDATVSLGALQSAAGAALGAGI